MDWTWITPLGAFLGAFGGLFANSYLGKKAENLATKEDVAEITRAVETVKSGMVFANKKAENLATKEDVAEITHTVESVKIGLQHLQEIQIHLYREQFAVIIDLWKATIRCRNLVMSLRPVMGFGPAPRMDTPEGVRRFNEYSATFNAFSEALDSAYLLIPDHIYNGLDEVRKAMFGEGIDYRIHDPERWPNYWDAAGTNQERIGALVKQAQTDLRAWLQSGIAAEPGNAVSAVKL